MQQRYATNPAQIPGMTTDELRASYLVPDLFAAGEIRVTYTHHDRIVLGGAVPAGAELALTGYPEIRSDYFLEHREVGIINVGGTGTVTADGEVYTLVKGACLYLGRGIRDVVFADADATPTPARSSTSSRRPRTPPTRRARLARARARCASSATSSPPTAARSTSTSTRTASAPARSSWA